MRGFISWLPVLGLALLVSCSDSNTTGGGPWYEVIDGLMVTQKDIVLGEPESYFRHSARLGVAYEDIGYVHRWSGGVVPYEIAPEISNPQRVLEAFGEFHAKTQVRFVPRMSHHSDYIRITRPPGNWCASYVGKHGGRQDLFLGDGCDKGNVIHELGHAIGLLHEQTRSDRDRFVRVLWQNVERGAESNFKTDSSYPPEARIFNRRVDFGSYDLESVMHSDRMAYSRNGLPTLESLDGRGFGRRDGLSAGDVATLASYYPDVKSSSDPNQVTSGGTGAGPIQYKCNSTTASAGTLPAPENKLSLRELSEVLPTITEAMLNGAPHPRRDELALELNQVLKDGTAQGAASPAALPSFAVQALTRCPRLGEPGGDVSRSDGYGIGSRADVNISFASQNVIVTKKSAIISYCDGDVILADGNVTVSHGSDCVILAGGTIEISHSTRMIAFSASNINVSFDGAQSNSTGRSAGALISGGDLKVSWAYGTLLYAVGFLDNSWDFGAIRLAPSSLR